MITEKIIDGFEFERFRNVKGSYVSRVSIRKQGHIGLSQGLLKKLGIREGEWFAKLYYDRSHNAMALGFSNDRTLDDVAKVQIRPSSANNPENLTAHIAAKAFLDYYGINYSQKTVSYEPEVHEDKMIVIVRFGKPAENDQNEGGEAMHEAE